MRYLLHFLIVTPLFFNYSFAQKGKLVLSANAHYSNGYQESIYNNYSAGFGYKFDIGYAFGGSGLQILGQIGKTHFDDNEYNYYVPGFLDSWGNEIWLATHMAGIFRWALPRGKVRPYIQASVGNTYFRYKDKIIVVDEVWDSENQEWDEEQSTYATYSETDGRASSYSYGGGLFFQTAEDILIDIRIIKKSYRDKINSNIYNPRYGGFQVGLGITFLL